MKLLTEFKTNVAEPIQYMSCKCPFCHSEIKRAKVLGIGHDYYEAYMEVRQTFSRTYDELLKEREKVRACVKALGNINEVLGAELRQEYLK